MTEILKTTHSELSPRPGGMSFKEIFGPERPAPISPTAAKWARAFADNVAAILRVRNIPRVEAERVAFENAVTTFLNATFADTPSDRCAHCSFPETPNNLLLPIGTGTSHTWLHSSCWEAWRDGRRAQAIAELAAMGISL